MHLWQDTGAELPARLGFPGKPLTLGNVDVSQIPPKLPLLLLILLEFIFLYYIIYY